MKYVQIGQSKSTDIGLRIRGYSRPSYAENRDVYTNTDGREGSNHHSRPDGMYRFSVVFRCKFKNETERVQMMEKISNLLYTEEFEKIVQSDLPDRYRLGKVANFVDYDPEFNVMEIDVEFVTQPYSFSNDQTTLTQDYSTSRTEFEQVVEDIGTAFSEFSIDVELKDAVDNLTVGVGDAQLFINEGVSVGEIIRINTTDFSVDKLKLSNGSITSIKNLILTVDGEFPVLSSRKNRLRVSSSKPFRCKTTLKYRKRFLL